MVEQRRDAGVLVLGLDAERTDAHAVDGLAPRRKCHQPNGSSRPFICFSTWLKSGSGERDADGLAVLLGDHGPVLVEDELELLGVVRRDLGLVVRARSPSCAPRPRCRSRAKTVDVACAGRACASCRSVMPCSGSHVSASVPDHRHARSRGRRCGAPTSAGPSPSSSPAALEQPLVVGRVPGLAGSSAACSKPSISDAALVVHREVHRADHAVAAALAQPGLGGGEQRRQRPRGRPRTRRSRTGPSALPVELVEAWSIWAVMRPTTRPSRRARK